MDNENHDKNKGSDNPESLRYEAFDPDIPLNPGLIQIPHSIGSALVRPEDMGKTKGRAMTAMREQTSRQMNQLYKQMQVLADQALEIRKRIEISEKIYMSQMGFDPIIGQVYYLYQKKAGINVLSMISPAEWGKRLPYEKFISSVKLLSDHTWEVLESDAE
jgi:hypothetical protein